MLIDELYFESSEEVSETDKRVHFSLFHVFMHAQQLWVTNLSAGQFAMKRGLFQKILIPNFRFYSLNILLRSSHHISAFSTAFIHRWKSVSVTSARVPGCFTSTQSEIPLRHFSSANHIKLRDSGLLNPIFSTDRRAIVFSEHEQAWKDALEKENLSTVSIVSPRSNFYSVPFTGCEALSVVVIIEDLPNEIHDKRAFGVINLAITRAQYEVCVFCHSDVFQRVEKFLTGSGRKWSLILLDVVNVLNVDLGFLPPYKKWDRHTCELVEKLLQFAVQQANVNLFNSMLDTFPGEDGKKPVPIRAIMACLDKDKPQEFQRLLERRIGEQAGRKLTIAISLESVKMFSKLRVMRASGL